MQVRTVELEARIENLSDDELHRMVGPAAGDYTPEAVRIAQAVLQRRQTQARVMKPEAPPAKASEFEEFIFSATRLPGPFQREKWEIRLHENSAEFLCPRTGESRTVSRVSARQSLALASLESGGYNLILVPQGKKLKFVLKPGDLSALMDWLPAGEASKMNEALESSPGMVFGRIFRTVLVAYFAFVAVVAFVASSYRGISFGEAFNQAFTNAYLQGTALVIVVVIFLIYKFGK